MAKVRIGYGTDFSLENKFVGIGTDTPAKYNLDLRNLRIVNRFGLRLVLRHIKLKNHAKL